ncbi:MAG TPA: aminotransferase class V-fold PLP-dependent enzyme [Gaiellaceae bacterium]|jgi:L-seryl-tRNA(Ser) seleniumtransferase
MSSIPVPRVISAAGFVTSLGGGSLSERVRAAMDEASASTWRPDDLQAWAGEVIAGATGAEAGWVTAGAAAGMTLGAAACIAGKRPDVMDALPETSSAAVEVIVQRGHRNAYDRTFRSAGARIVEVGYPLREGVGLTYEWQLEAAFSERTAAVAHFALAESEGVPLRRVCELAGRHDVPVIVDAAAELPPASNLRRFLEEGAALVAFSGGKAIRGPQGSGILAGRRDLVESVRLQTLDMDIDVEAWIAREGTEPPHHGLGRSMKIGKEQIVGLVVALQEFLVRDHEREAGELRGWLESLVDAVRIWPAEVADGSHFYPRLVVTLDPERARACAQRLAAAEPAIVVPHAPLARGELVIAAEAITRGDRPHVEASLAALAEEGAAGGRPVAKERSA